MIFSKDKAKQEIASKTLQHSLISREKLIEYIDLMIHGAKTCGNKDNFPANTDKDMQYFENKVEFYEEMKRHLNTEISYTDTLKLIIGVK